MTSRTENNNNNKESTMNEEMVVALINSTRESLAAAVFRITELEAELKVEKSKNESLLGQLKQPPANNK